MEPRSATRAAKGSKWGPFGFQISIKFQLLLDFFACETRSGPEDVRNRPSEPKIEKNAIGGTKNDRESDAKHQKDMNMHHNSNVRTKQQLSILTELPKL